MNDVRKWLVDDHLRWDKHRGRVIGRARLMVELGGVHRTRPKWVSILRLEEVGRMGRKDNHGGDIERARGVSREALRAQVQGDGDTVQRILGHSRTA